MKKSTNPVPASAETPMHERILGAAFQAFMEEGYAGTSTLDIATRAKVSKRDLYANFASKHAVLVDCIKGRADRMRLPRLPRRLRAAAKLGRHRDAIRRRRLLCR